MNRYERIGRGIIVWGLIVACFATLVLYLLSVPAESQCLPGQSCPSCLSSTQGWRVATPRVSRTAVRQPQTQSGVYRWDPGVPMVPTRIVKSNPAIVRVVVDEGNCTGVGCKGCKSLGTGTIFDRQEKKGVAAVVTAAHLFSDVTQASKYYVEVQGKRYNASLHHIDTTWDVAILAIWDPGVQPIALAQTAPTRGSVGELSGFGSGNYRQVTGRLTKYVAPRRGIPLEWVEYSVGSRDGDSGGPMLNAQGQLVGIISRTNGGCTVGCAFPRLRSILRCVLPPYPRRPAVIVPRPIVVVPTPALPPTQPDLTPSVTTAVLDYDKLADAIVARLDLEALRGPTGPAGEPGTPGRQGPVGVAGSAGPQGSPGVVDIEDLTEKIKKRIEGSIRVKVRPINPK